MNHFVFIVVLAFFQEVPFKPREEFEVKLDYQFRQRPVADHNTVNFGESRTQSTETGVLPYLILNIKMLAVPDDKSRILITTNLSDRAIVKKVSSNSVLTLDLGFTVDMIDRVQAHEYIVTFIKPDKKPLDRIVISIGEDGSFFVNGEKRGKF